MLDFSQMLFRAAVKIIIWAFLFFFFKMLSIFIIIIVIKKYIYLCQVLVSVWWILSSLTRDWTQAPRIGSMEP